MKIKKIMLLLALTTSLAQAQGMVVTENGIASKVGADILRAGGNAIDAAVAVGYSLAVVNPCCGNIGGGGFMLIHLANGKNIFINFREKAPLKASKNMYLDANGNVIPNKSVNGYLAVAVPGTVLGLDTALKQYGTMTRKQVMTPAIRLARQGFTLTPYLANEFAKYANDFRAHPEITAIFLKNGKLYQAGDKLIQADLANSLEAIANQGPAVFYRGYIAKAIVEASNRNGGILTMQDFATYNIKETKPLQCHYHHYELLTAPPPSSGGITLCEMLNILENFPLAKLGYHSPKSAQIAIETMRYGYTDRNTKLGDPDFIHNPIQELTSKKYAHDISVKIGVSKVVPKQEKCIAHEFTDTTHYSVLDSKGNAVAVTYTLNGMFGAKVIADHTGFFLNDEMDDFTAKPCAPNKFGLVMNEKNAIQSGKRPLSSMTPTIILKNGKVFLVLGSPGGPRIISSVLLTILNVINYGMTLQDAVNAPRFHYQVYPDIVDMEPNAFSLQTINELEKMGYQINPTHTWSAVEAIRVDPMNGKIEGANDRRRPDGGAVGE